MWHHSPAIYWGDENLEYWLSPSENDDSLFVGNQQQINNQTPTSMHDFLFQGTARPTHQQHAYFPLTSQRWRDWLVQYTILLEEEIIMDIEMGFFPQWLHPLYKNAHPMNICQEISLFSICWQMIHFPPQAFFPPPLLHHSAYFNYCCCSLDDFILCLLHFCTFCVNLLDDWFFFHEEKRPIQRNSNNAICLKQTNSNIRWKEDRTWYI